MTKQWIDHNGQVIPSAYVPKLDKDRDRVAQRYAKKAIDLRDRIAAFKEELLETCDDLYDQMMAENKVNPTTKGGYTVTSFDKAVKIEVAVSQKIEFDDRIQVAQEMINKYLADKTGDIDDDLRQIINLAFQTTKGSMDVKRVLSLFSLNIKSKQWLDAMEVLKKSITRNHTRRYARVWVKDDQGNYQNVELNFSSI